MDDVCHILDQVVMFLDKWIGFIPNIPANTAQILRFTSGFSVGGKTRSAGFRCTIP
jgi:hypothetical protein